MNPIVEALRELGGSASLQDVDNQIVEDNEISDDDLSVTTSTGAIKVLNDIAWSRDYLVKEGILDKNSPRGIWTLSDIGEKIVISS